MKLYQIIILILLLSIISGCGSQTTQTANQDGQNTLSPTDSNEPLSVDVAMIPDEGLQVTDFDSCIAAGNPAMESYPRQCRHEDRTYTEIIEKDDTEPEQPAEQDDDPEEMILGGDSDEHGCKASAGYQWCPSTDRCQRIWEEPCPPEQESESEWGLVQTYDEEMDRVTNIAMIYLNQLDEFDEFTGRGERVNNIQKKECEGCFDVEAQFERDSPKAPGIVVTAIYHITLEGWEVTDHTATYTEE